MVLKFRTFRDLTSSSVAELETAKEHELLGVLRLEEAFLKNYHQHEDISCFCLVSSTESSGSKLAYDAPKGPLSTLGPPLNLEIYFDRIWRRKFLVPNLHHQSFTILLPLLHTVLLGVSIRCYRFNLWLQKKLTISFLKLLP